MPGDNDVSDAYRDDCAALPVDAPIGHPHLIDLRCLTRYEDPPRDITIADLIVTVLSWRPAALRGFLNLKRRRVVYLHETNGFGFCILRHRRRVKVI